MKYRDQLFTCKLALVILTWNRVETDNFCTKNRHIYFIPVLNFLTLSISQLLTIFANFDNA